MGREEKQFASEESLQESAHQLHEWGERATAHDHTVHYVNHESERRESGDWTDTAYSWRYPTRFPSN